MLTNSQNYKSPPQKEVDISEKIKANSEKFSLLNSLGNLYKNRVSLTTRKISLIEEKLKSEPNAFKSKTYKSLEINKNNNCPFGNQCAFYNKYIKLKKEIEKVISSNNRLILFNKSLFSSLHQKSKDYQYLMKENSLLKKVIFKINGITYNELIKNKIVDAKTNTIFLGHKIDKIKRLKINKDDQINHTIRNILSNIIERNKNQTINNYQSYKNTNINKDKNHINMLSMSNSSKNSDDLNFKNMKRNKSNNIKIKLMNENKKMKEKIKDLSLNNKANFINLINNTQSKRFKSINTNKSNMKTLYKTNNEKEDSEIEDSPEKHYDTIKKYYYKRERRASMFTIKFSLLSLNLDLTTVMDNNVNKNKLEDLVKNDQNYLNTIKKSSENELLKYSDSISCLINDYKEMIRLGMRMKDFMKSSILLVDSIISNDSSKIFIDNICHILKCDRASLFLYDQMSDSLVVYSGEGLKRAQIKIPKDKGIVGVCFMEHQKIRIDDAYMDQRFNKEVDIRTNYRTRSILCYPLVDNDGKCFGVIEAINKFDSSFNDDDEELLKLLSHQASTIFKNAFHNDDNKFFIKKLFLLIDYCNKISHINNKKEFNDKTEEFLLNFYNCIISAFFFVENDKVVKYCKENNEKKEFETNIGIVGKVIKTKEIIAYENLKNAKEFNSIIDLETSSGLLVFPILAKKTKDVCAVIQIPFSGEINKSGKPKESEIKIINKLCKCIKNWIFNYNLIDK